ncbi:uncharacterized protein isoform X2 [Rhodnius prolixus]|uniref:uncharacterized protein isoform X2 n=1 Tax=Rhodnius prolixus TaxID=13249 RepID=UPI003D18C7FD
MPKKKKDGWLSPFSEGSLEYYLNPPPSRKAVRYKKNKYGNKKVHKQISVLAEKLDKTWRKKLHLKIKEDSDSIKKMFEQMNEEETEVLQDYDEPRKFRKEKGKRHTNEEDDIGVDSSSDVSITSSNTAEYELDEEDDVDFRRKYSTAINTSPSNPGENCVIKEIGTIENIGDWDVILSDEEWYDNDAMESDKFISKEGVKIVELPSEDDKNNEQKTRETKAESEENDEEDEGEEDEGENQSENDDSEEYLELEDDSEEESEEEYDQEKKALLEKRMSTLNDTLEKLKAELFEARQAVEEEKKTIMLPGHACTIAEPCSVAAQLEERLRARREAAAASYCEGLQQVERMVSQEIIRLEEDMHMLQPLNQIAADWEIPQDSKLKQ